MATSSPGDRVVECDFLILGSGLAGLDLALHLAELGSVIILTKSALEESNSLYAQGGIAAVLDPLHDRSEDHITDTLTAGAGLCHQDTVRFVVENGPQAIQRLIDLGVTFTKDEQGYHLTREGGHSARRVIHAADATGKAVVETLLEQVQFHPRIKLLPYYMGVDLITCHKMGHVIKENRVHGCYALDIQANVVRTFQAKFTILATGGAGKVYLYTSNPDVATGDGIAMAYRAGCQVANMEFIQFHPTCLYHPQAKSFLISEAVRGEGGILRLKNGEAFMARHHPLKELAPRDIVARAIDAEMKRTGHDCVFLDITHKSGDFIREHFPTIYGKCLSLGIDITREPIPVVPAAHYTCGGVMTNLVGQTTMDCLYAIGEASHTGLHGANRLASNSLLECLVFAKATADDIRHRLENNPPHPPPRVPVWDSFDTGPYEEAVVISHNWDEIRRSMWNYVGIVRSNHRLARAHRRIELLQKEINEYYWSCQITQDLLELRNIALVAALIIRSAMHRKESRGLHFTIDHPNRDDEHWLKDTILPVT
ncbi:MAG: L-aspartate oxidase [Magnetococcales bacterium]|nr:L-aspartate oxidase [Magnetococcales bacterium]NGZ25514.1 L-aspartate oxidase [Magnetococcales bacterium]